jgi:hypothetical protein
MESLFRKESMDQLMVHDRVGEYVSTTDRKGWLLLVAMLLLITSFIVWAFTGSLPVAISCSGYSSDTDKEAHLFVDPDVMHNRNIDIGDKVHVIFPDARQIEGKVMRISPYPMTDEEIADTFGYNEWIISKITTDGSYHYVILFEAEEPLEKDMLFDAQIIEETVVPIRFFID